ncbi:hypothetical protein F5Y14DRAFT_102787 [Nemania sp. NC0429]|nr:hypothetical protein F5Y14DRAFT_102787 [Nemania sp. NC0429]
MLLRLTNVRWIGTTRRMSTETRDTSGSISTSKAGGNFTFTRAAPTGDRTTRETSRGTLSDVWPKTAVSCPLVAMVVQIFRTVKKDFVCGWNFTEETGKWHCAKERKQSEFWTAQWVDAPAPTKRNPYYYFPAGYQPGVISSELWTWWMKYPPNSTTGPVELEYRIPDNPYSNQTFLPGDGTYPVVMEFILESLNSTSSSSLST